MANNWSMVIPAESWTAQATSGPQPKYDSGSKRLVWSFDDTTVEELLSPQLVCPLAHTGAGTLKLDIWYRMNSATSGSVVWSAKVGAISDGDAFDTTTTEFGTTNASGGVAVPGTAKYVDKATITLTNDDDLEAGDLLRLQLERTSSNGSDTASGDAELLSVELYEAA